MTALAQIAAQLELVRPQIMADGNDLMESQGMTMFAASGADGTPKSEILVYVIRGDRRRVSIAFAPDMGPGLHRSLSGDLGCFELRFPLSVSAENVVADALAASKVLAHA